MYRLELENVTKSFSKKEIIKPFSVGIGQGEFLVLLGPSGCGKSTILRLIAGLENVDSGVIRIDGQTVNKLQPAERDLAMVFQSYALYPHMTVFDNIAFGLKMRGFSKADIRQRVEEAARFLQLTDYLDYLPAALSGGQRQRVAMGRAVVRRPKIFLFDEPLSNLDAKLRMELRSEIKRLHKKLGVTTIYVTHDQEEAMSLADRIIVLRDGVIEQDGSPAAIFNRPRNRFIAEFLGNPRMNIHEFPVDPETRAIELGELKLAVNEKGVDKVLLGIRPGDISFYPKEHWVYGGKFHIESTEMLGDSTLVHGSIQRLSTVVTTNSKNTPPTGDINCYINPENLSVFDPATGRAIH
jgi:ABC-type sugar transport system ATPase subunit